MESLKSHSQFPERIINNKEKIYPWIKTTFSQKSHKKITFDIGSEPLNKDWLGGLKILYVIDEGKEVSFIMKKEIPEGYDISDIHNLAIQNLERDIEYRFNELNFGGGYGLLAGGDYEASAITLPTIWELISNELNDDLIISIPAKDLVLITTLSDADGIINIVEATNDIFLDGEHLLSKSLFKFSKTNKEWSLYRP